MAKPKYRFLMYKKLQNEKAQIFAEAKKFGESLNIPSELRGSIGLTGAISGCPSPLREDIEKAMAVEGQKVVPLNVYIDQIREIVKDVYGDEYDACPANTCEASLWTSIDTLFTVPMQGRGDKYRTRYIAPLERHLHHQGGYGRPFPPKYKDILADRGSTAGELGFYGKRQDNLDVVYVPMPGADYTCHGIKYHPVQLMKNLDTKESIEAIRTTAERFADTVSGFVSLGYDTTGYGYGDKDGKGTPKLSKGIAEIAKSYNVPYVMDNAWGIPFIGTSVKEVGADVMCFSMDKASGSPTAGLMIGKEECLVPIRRALGVHGARFGTGSSYGKAAYVTFDPGKEALSGMVAALKVLRDTPEKMKKPINELYEIVVQEFAKIDSRIKPFFKIEKSFNSGAVEINYEDSWKDGKMGIPIFSIEDMYSASNIFQDGMSQMGIIPTIAYDANIFISPGLGTTDHHGNLIHERMQECVKGLVKLIEITCEHAGTFE